LELPFPLISDLKRFPGFERCVAQVSERASGFEDRAMSSVLRKKGPQRFAPGPEADPGPAEIGKEPDFHVVVPCRVSRRGRRSNVTPAGGRLGGFLASLTLTAAAQDRQHRRWSGSVNQKRGARRHETPSATSCRMPHRSCGRSLGRRTERSTD